MKSLLRRPSVIILEVLVITLFCALGASLPQVGRSTAAEVAKLREYGAFVTALVDGLGLDHIFTGYPFLISLVPATASLVIVVMEQLRRVRAQWNLMPTEGAFKSAPFRREFIRPAHSASPARTAIRVQGRISLAGSPLFHLGLLSVVLAGTLGALFSTSATVDLFEGETLPPTVEAWGAQWPGVLAQPFRLEAPLTLQSVTSTHYPSGTLKGLRLGVTLASAAGEHPLEMGINDDLPMERGRLYSGQNHGPAALVEWFQSPGSGLRQAVLLEPKEPTAFGAYGPGPGPLRARIRAEMPGGDLRPGSVQVRILVGPQPIAEGVLRPGESLDLPGGGQFKLHGLPYWARVHGHHDPGLGLAYAGFIMALVGISLTYGVTRVDELVSVTPEGDQERVVVALRPHRFAPLYQERFERLVATHGGTP